ncbi:MAG: uncharacterized protein A8A55_2543, partial [Amphiamblys sp. WSBS2006]
LESKVVLSNVAVSDSLFFKLMGRTSVTIRNKISLFGHNRYLSWCIGELARTTERIDICFNGYTSQEIKQIHKNIKKIPRKSIQVNAREIHAKEDGICFLPKLFSGVDGYSPDIFLTHTKKEHIEEFLKEVNNLSLIGKVKRLALTENAIQALPKLKLHEGNKMDMLSLEIARHSKNISEILKTENNSIWLRNVRGLELKKHAVEILPKLKLHEENEMDVLSLCADRSEHITGIFKTERNSIWMGKTKKLKLEDYAVEILPKLRIHEENMLDVLVLNANHPRNVKEILKRRGYYYRFWMGNGDRSLFVGKVKNLILEGHAVKILPMLDFHRENEMEELVLNAYKDTHTTGIHKTKKKSIWMGKVRKVSLEGCAEKIRGKLDFVPIAKGVPEENEGS